MNSLGKFPHLHDQQGSLLGVSIPAATHVGSIFSSKKWLSLLALIGLAYRASYSIKFTQQISPLTLNCAFTMPKPQPTSPAAVEAFQRGQPRPPSLLPGFLGSCHLRFLCSQRFFDLILSRSKDRRDFLLVDTESCTNKASTFIFIIRFCVKPHVKTPCFETEMKLPKPFFLCLIQTTPFLKRTFHQRPKTKSKADSIAQEPTKKHPSITNSKNLPPTIGIYIYICPSSFFKSKWHLLPKCLAKSDLPPEFYGKYKNPLKSANTSPMEFCSTVPDMHELLSWMPPLATIWETCSKLMVLGSKHKSSDDVSTFGDINDHGFQATSNCNTGLGTE